MLSAMIVMILIDLLLFWAPLVGPIVAGLVGGWVAGSPGLAMMAAVLPAIVVGVVLFLAFTYFGLPVVGGFLGLGLTVYLVITRVLLIVAAAIGGALAR
jgi:hypothetical protein